MPYRTDAHHGNFRAVWTHQALKAARPIAMIDSTIAVSCDGTSSTGILILSAALEKAKLVVTPLAVRSPKTMKDSTAMTPSVMGSPHCLAARISGMVAAGADAVTAVMPRPPSPCAA